MTVTKARRTRFLLAPLAALVLTACGGTDVPPPGDATATAVPTATESAINPLPRDQVQDGGTLVWPINAMPVNFNYYHLDGTESDSSYVDWAMMPFAFVTGASGIPAWNPNLLVAEPVLVTDPQQVVTYEIHPEAVWYDGTPVTWEDFHWQWRALSGADPAYQISAANVYEDVESVEMGTHPGEVVVTYARPTADWQSIFGPLYPASTNRDTEIFNTGWLEQPLTTAGPFKLDNIDRTAQTITLVRNERWWGPTARLDRIVYRTIQGDAQIDALANGEVDFIDVATDANKYNRALGIAGVEIRYAGGPNFGHITLNGASRNLQDVRVRRAVAMGIDRGVIAQALLGPLGIDPEPLGNHIFMANQAGYQDNSGEVGTYNPEGARALLDEAGWVLDGDVRSRDGQALEIGFTIPGGIATSQQIAELAQNMLGQVGGDVRIQVVPVADFFDQYIIPGQYDLTIFSWIGDPFPISSSKSIYGVPRTGADGQLDVQQNFARVGSEEIDRLFDEANAEFDRARAIAIANEMDARIWDLVHSLALYQRPEIYASREGLANHGAWGFQRPPVYEDIGWAITD